MSSPTTRQTLIDFCLRRLGAPVIEINVDIDQVEDCVDDAIQLYREFHTDATKRLYISHQVTSTDVTNKWIPITADVMNVVRVLPFDMSQLGTGTGMFSLKYQLHYNDLVNMNNLMGDLSYYSQFGQYLETLDMVLTGQPQVTFSRHENRVYIHGEWFDQELVAGEWVVMEVYSTIDPNAAPKIYNDMFIKNYTTALIKQRWGQNMSKFEGIQLPGGVTISGQRILEEANAELQRLEEKLRSEFELPPDFMIG